MLGEQVADPYINTDYKEELESDGEPDPDIIVPDTALNAGDVINCDH